MRVLITGSCGLIGSEAVIYYASQRNEVCGIDNNLRQYFFGPGGDTTGTREQLLRSFSNYKHEAFDIRDRAEVFRCIREFQPDFILHAASQPSHDWAAREPFTDFEVNAMATLNLLEGMRQFAPKAVFVFMSTNKVYGDAPNFLPMDETATRYEYKSPMKGKGIDETLSVDRCLHSLFGASKLSADILCQEYGKYFGLNVGILRGGCLTGSRHAGVELHGFLNYIILCGIEHKTYSIFGYKGKQVRDQIHSSDVLQACELFRKNPRAGEVYNLGGGFENSASLLEVVNTLKAEFGVKVNTTYVDQARKGDHICYYSDMSKFRSHYPSFRLGMSLPNILKEIVEGLSQRKKKAA